MENTKSERDKLEVELNVLLTIERMEGQSIDLGNNPVCILPPEDFEKIYQNMFPLAGAWVSEEVYAKAQRTGKYKGKYITGVWPRIFLPDNGREASTGY